jgi:type IV pilus assembly protein PilW
MHLPPTRHARQRGFTLVELMVASAIGLAILAAMSTLFLSNSRAQSEIERANRQVDNGRYALQLISSDLRSAGYFSEYDPTEMNVPTAIVDACSIDLALIRTALPLHVQGYDGSDGGLSCLSDVKTGTDVVVIRRTASCIVDAANCETNAAGGPYFQASLCDDPAELGSTDPARHFSLDTDTSRLTLRRHGCATAASVRRFFTRIYFVANNDRSNDHVPTLKRADLVSVNGTMQFVVQSQVNGIENLQLEYGVDTNGDGVPDLYTAAPGTANGCATAVCGALNWNGVMSAKINVLSRSSDPTPGYVDSKSYAMGLNADGSANTIAAARDGYKRHVFESLVTIPNPAGRRAR